MVRLRHRYIISEIIPTKRKSLAALQNLLTHHNLIAAINKAIRHLHGIQGVALAKAGLMVKYLNPPTGVLFIRMRRSAYQIVSSVLPFVTLLGSEAIMLKTLYTGATIRHCNIFLAKYQRKQLEERYKGCTPVEKEVFQKELDGMKRWQISL